MSKAFKYLIILCLTIIILSGCSNSSENALKAAKDFKEMQFNVSLYDYQDGITPELLDEVRNKLSPFQTKDFQIKQTKNRILTLPLEVARVQNSTMSLENLKFKTISEDKDIKAINLSYTAILGFDNKNVQKININGVMNLINEDGAWKVSYDNFNVKDLFDLTSEKQ